MQGTSIGASLWRNYGAGPCNFSHDSITSTAALDKWFHFLPKYRTKIEGDQPLPEVV